MDEDYEPVTLDQFLKTISGVPDCYDSLYVDVTCRSLRKIIEIVKINGSISLAELTALVDNETCEMTEYFQGDPIAH